MKLSSIKQDKLIEQLREQHKKIVADGRQRLVGNLMKNSISNVRNKQRYPAAPNADPTQPTNT